MPLNLLKVQKLMYGAGFIIDTFFISGKRCQYLKATSLVSGDSLVIYISPTYDFFVDQSAGNVFTTRLIEFDSGENVPERYGDYPDMKALSDRYGQTLKLHEDMNEDELEAEMENNYRKRIDLKSLEKEQIIIVKDCFRQLKRLALAMEGIRYKLCIIQDRYLCTFNQDIVECYFIKNHTTDGKRLFFVMSDLEYFYEKMSNINGDIDTIKLSIYRLLDKNGETNIETLVKISKRLSNIETSDKEVTRLKVDYTQQIQRYRLRLEEYNKQESKIKGEISNLDTDGGFYNDTSYINKKASLEGQLNGIDSERQKILKLIIQLKQKCDNIYLNYDKIEFDNCILINGITKNFSDLDNVLKIKS